MSNMNALKREIEALLGDGYYYEQAPEATAYPYRVGLLQSSFDDEVSEVFAFELDYWGEKSSDLDALIEADAGDGNPVNPSGLNKMILSAQDLSAKIDRENVLDVRDPDANIRHKRASYTIRLYHL